MSLPTARAAGIAGLEIVVDAHERYAWGFADQQVQTVKRALSCGDYAVAHEGRVVAAVERKSMTDLISSLTNGRLRYALGERSGPLVRTTRQSDHLRWTVRGTPHTALRRR